MQGCIAVSASSYTGACIALPALTRSYRPLGVLCPAGNDGKKERDPPEANMLKTPAHTQQQQPWFYCVLRMEIPRSTKSRKNSNLKSHLCNLGLYVRSKQT